jgi:glycosyltransferase involved in cell wall biosynthesis
MSSISVIVTCHNLERYIGAAIDSVLSQDYTAPVEILVIDDYSTDHSACIIKSCPGVRYIRTSRNLGVLLTTVLGLREASGNLVFFLDGDDIWRSDKLSVMMQRFESDPQLSFLTHDLEYIDCNGVKLSRPSRPEQVMRGDEKEFDKKIREGILLHSDYVWLGSAYALRRSKIDLEGFCFWAEALPDPFNTYQDWPLAYWVAIRPDAKMDYVPSKLLQYRVHGANYSGDARSAEKAVRNISRGYNTMRAMHSLALRSDVSGEVWRESRLKLYKSQYMLDLYRGHKLRALRTFIKVTPHFLNERVLSKELLRFLAVQICGLKVFVRFMNWWKYITQPEIRER